MQKQKGDGAESKQTSHSSVMTFRLFVVLNSLKMSKVWNWISQENPTQSAEQEGRFGKDGDFLGGCVLKCNNPNHPRQGKDSKKKNIPLCDVTKEKKSSFFESVSFVSYCCLWIWDVSCWSTFKIECILCLNAIVCIHIWNCDPPRGRYSKIFVLAYVGSAIAQKQFCWIHYTFHKFWLVFKYKHICMLWGNFCKVYLILENNSITAAFFIKLAYDCPQSKREMKIKKKHLSFKNSFSLSSSSATVSITLNGFISMLKIQGSSNNQC